jgi:hypothetical protein
MNREISNQDDVIDSRDVIARIDELESEIYAEDAPEDAIQDVDELAALKEFAEEAKGYAPDWHHGATLIRDSYFEDYAREFAEDIGGHVDRWPYTCIDWKQAARELQYDYSAVEFDGVTYWVR